jgi:hypothetical protein
LKEKQTQNKLNFERKKCEKQGTGNRKEGTGDSDEETEKREQGMVNRLVSYGRRGKAYPGRTRSAHHCLFPVPYSLFPVVDRHSKPGQDVVLDTQGTILVTSKSNERTWNVYENKGPTWKTRGRCWYVFENKRLNL